MSQKIEIIPEDKKNKGSISSFRIARILILVSIIVLLLIGVLQGIIIFLNRRINAEQGKLREIGFNQLIKKAEEINRLDQQIENIKRVTNLKNSPLEVLELLQKSTLPNVYWLNFSFKRDNQTVLLSGIAPDYQTAGQQILILEKAGFKKKTVSNNFSLDQNNQVKFGGSFIFTPKKKVDLLK